jgi:hypothetical protein
MGTPRVSTTVFRPLPAMAPASAASSGVAHRYRGFHPFVIASILLLSGCGGGGGDSADGVSRSDTSADLAPAAGIPRAGQDPVPASGPILRRRPAPGPATSPAPSPFQTTAPMVLQNALPSASAARIGAWSPLVPWPLIAIHATVLPDGRVMTYGTDKNGKQTGKFFYDVWVPSLGTDTASHLTLPNYTDTDILCSAQLVLPQSGDLLINGGDIYDDATNRALNLPTTAVTLFKPSDNSLQPAGKMNRPRWYGTATTLPTGEVYLQGGSGGQDRAEVRDDAGKFRLLTGFKTGYLGSSYPRNFVGPDGKIFGMAYTEMYRIDPYANLGQGTLTRLGTISGYLVDWTSSAVMYLPGRILQVGGADNKAAIIDINGSKPVITSAGTMTQVRAWSNANVLADGRVAITGGSTIANDSSQVAYQIELFDPKTRSWTVGPSAQRMRLYHSTSLLLADATLLAAGGGAPGPQTNLNAEIYYPPYLFREDGTPAPRPTISAAPTVVDPTAEFRLKSPQRDAIARVTMVASGSTSHSNDMNQRFLELSFHRDGDELVVQLPSNAYETPPGFYMVFVIDDAGTPSVARIVRLNAAYDWQ